MALWKHSLRNIFSGHRGAVESGLLGSRVFHVDAALGNDANTGRTPDDPWQTIDPKVNGETFRPTDHILLQGLFREQLTIPSSGIAGNPITFGVYGSGATISGADIITGWAAYSGWAAAFSQVLNKNGNGAANRQRRQILAAADITGTGAQIRLTLQAATGGDAVIDGVSLGQRTGVTDDMVAAPTRVTWDTGNNGVTITAGEQKVSDAIVFTLDDTVDHLIHVYQGSGTFSYAYQDVTGGGSYDDAVIAGDETVQQNVVYGGPTANFSFWVAELEVLGAINTWQSALATEPNQVFMDGTRLTEGADADSLNDHEWFWAANVLYLRDDSGDPDGTGVVIEASVRDRSIDFNGQDYVTVEDLDCEYTNGSAILVDGDNFVLRNIDVSYPENSSISVWGSGAAITNGLIDGCAATYSHADQGIFVGFGADPGPGGVIVQNCMVNNNGVDTQDNGIYFSRTHGCTARYNTSRDNAGSGIIFQFGADDNECYYNLVYDNGFDGIWIGVGDAGDNNNIYNNVLFNNAETDINVGANADGNVIKNNIAFQDSAVVGAWKPCIQFANATVRQAQTWNYNCAFYDGQAANTYHDSNLDDYYTLAQFQALAGSPGANSISSDPVFVNEGIPDFHLQVGSLCRNVGDDVGLTRDYDGVTVPQETNPAIGAYEYVA